ncbi:MAG TPA: alkaline phosphatase family protein [Clostridiales bacterium]|nr:alkaline phosphatase family protein [Clostridiales bacterium]HQP69168.1 alkaline phosphatase family protein [Clostridiales bacterium]
MKNIIIKTLAVIILISAAMIYYRFYWNGHDGYMPYLKVAGDVKNVLYFNRLESGTKTGLKNIIKKAEPAAMSFDVIFAGTDGLAAKIDDRLDRVSLNFSVTEGWEIIDEDHPVSSHIKHLKEIIVVSKEGFTDNSVTVFSPDSNIISVSPGQMYEKTLSRTLKLEGESKIKRETGEYGVSVYSIVLSMPVSDVINAEYKRLMIISSDGKNLYTGGQGQLIYDDNRILYSDETGDNPQEIKGIMPDPPEKSVSDAYHDALNYIYDGKKVMVIFLDGFSCAQYEYAVKNKMTPYLAELDKAQKASTYFKPVTNVGFAAMITGTGPIENGIHDRSGRALNSTIFQILKEKGLKSILIEADISILDSNADERLNTDRNGNGSIDDEIFEAAKKESANGYDYMLVHFHRIDDMGHKHGPFGKETLDQISIADGYVKDLVNNFSGKVIILSDHGMHETSDGGSHGQARREDFIVPYFITDGGI